MHVVFHTLLPAVPIALAFPVQAIDFGSVTPVTSVQTMISGITQSELQQTIAQLTGDSSVGDPTVTLTNSSGSTVTTTITTRSAKDPRVSVAVDYLIDRLRSYGYKLNAISDSKVMAQTYPGTGVVPSARNVIAEIPGTTNASEIVIVAAHLDDRPWFSPAYGADDDASGCAAVLKIAKEFYGEKFARTIRFAFFNAEEDAPWSGSGKNFGSGYYAAGVRAAEENVVAMVEADALAWNLNPNNISYMVIRKPGKDTGGGDLAIANLWISAISAYKITGIIPKVQASGDYLSDHGSFWANGYNAMMFIEDDVSQVNPNWHQITDRVGTDGWRWDYYVQNAKSLMAASAHLAGVVQPRGNSPVIRRRLRSQ